MKQFILLAVVVSCLVAQLQAFQVDLVIREGKNNNTIKVIELEDKTIVALKEAIKKETGVEIKDQRLVSYDRPIIEQTLLSELKENPEFGVPVVILTKPLKNIGFVYVHIGHRWISKPAKDGETLLEFKNSLEADVGLDGWKILFGSMELTDDTKTLDYYQIGLGDHLAVTEIQKF